MRDAPIRGPPYNPGAGGWPTIRYFNRETGPDGAAYEKKTDLPICSELMDVGRMTDYIELAGKTTLEGAAAAEAGEEGAKVGAEL